MNRRAFFARLLSVSAAVAVLAERVTHSDRERLQSVVRHPTINAHDPETCPYCQSLSKYAKVYADRFGEPDLHTFAKMARESSWYR